MAWGFARLVDELFEGRRIMIRADMEGNEDV